MSCHDAAGTAAPAVPPGPADGALTRLGAKHALVLGLFTLGATLVLALMNFGTRSTIAERRLEDLRASLSQVLPEAIYDNNPATDTLRVAVDGSELTVYRARRGSAVTGVAFQMAPAGYSGRIHLLLGIDPQGRLLGVRVLSHTETPGLGDKIEIARSDWITRFTGLSLGDPPEDKWAVKKDGGPFDQFAGATITPRAVVNGVRDGLRLFAARRDVLLQEAR